MENRICDHCKKLMGNSQNTVTGAGELEIFVHSKCSDEWYICNEMGDMADFVKKQEEKKEFECDGCCEMKLEPSDDINGNGKYCGACVRKMFREDMECDDEYGVVCTTNEQEDKDGI